VPRRRGRWWPSSPPVGRAARTAAPWLGGCARFRAAGCGDDPVVPAFVDYTRMLLHGVPEPVAVVAAAGATGVEVALAVLLLAGALLLSACPSRRPAAAATAASFER